MEETTLTKAEQYEQLRKQKTQAYKDKQNAKRGINPDGGNFIKEVEFTGNDLDRLEQLNLDAKDEDQSFYDQFNPMASKAQANLKLKGQNQRMDKDTAQRIQFSGAEPDQIDPNQDTVAIQNPNRNLNNVADLDDLEEITDQP